MTWSFGTKPGLGTRRFQAILMELGEINLRRKLGTMDEFFMVLVRMRLGLFELDLAHRFRCADILR